MPSQPNAWRFAFSVSPAPAVPRQRIGPLTVPELRWAALGRYPPRLCLVILAYYLAAHIGYAFQFAGPVASIVWLPVGVGIAALYLLGPDLWPGVVIGDLLVNNYSTLPLGSAIGQTTGNLLEVLIAALLLRRFATRTQLLGSMPGLGYMILALTAGTLVSASVGGISLLAGHVVSGHAVAHLWRTWWLGDVCGALIVVPLALAWFPPPSRPWFRGRLIELTLLAAALIGLSTFAWVGGARPLSYLALPALTWAALRFGPRGGTVAIAVSVGFALWAATHYMGPFAFRSVNRSLLETQLYVVLATVATLSVAVLASEREKLAGDIRASRARIITAGDIERRRIERNIHDGAQQRLVALAAHLSLAADRARADPLSAGTSFDSAREELQLAIDDLRELAHGIRPPDLRRFGLARAVELAAVRAKTPVQIGELPRERLDATAEATAYFVVLEAITNADKHARAAVIVVQARLIQRRLEIMVEDDGVGGATEQPGRGLQGLRDRVEATGGRFRLDSVTGRGTRIVARVPAVVVPLAEP